MCTLKADKNEIVLLLQLGSNYENQKLHAKSDQVKIGGRSVSKRFNDAGFNSTSNINVGVHAVAALVVESDKINISTGRIPNGEILKIISDNPEYDVLKKLLLPDENGHSALYIECLAISWQDPYRAKESVWGKSIIDVSVQRYNDDEFTVIINPYTTTYFVFALKAGGNGVGSWMEVNRPTTIGYIGNGHKHAYKIGEEIAFDSKDNFKSEDTASLEEDTASLENVQYSKSVDFLFVPEKEKVRTRGLGGMFRGGGGNSSCTRSFRPSRHEIVTGSQMEACSCADTQGKDITNSVFSRLQVVKLKGECDKLPIENVITIANSLLFGMLSQIEGNSNVFFGSNSHKGQVAKISIDESHNISICDTTYEEFIEIVGEAKVLSSEKYYEIMELVKAATVKVPNDKKNDVVIDIFKKAISELVPKY